MFFNPCNNIVFNVKDLNRIKVSGAASISSEEIKVDSLAVDISGAGKVNINVEVQNLESKMSGTGQFTINGSAVKENIIVSDAGQYNGGELVSQETKVRISGAGKISYS